MSLNYPYGNNNLPQYRLPNVIVHNHDVLSGRGVNIAQHPGNERFRSLVTTRADASYCETYSASEKRAVAENIIKHIQALDPPGRFLRREGRGQVSRGLKGPWIELSYSQAVKKTCQALRDCNRQDRQGYAAAVQMPDDVVREAERLASSGIHPKDEAVATLQARGGSNAMYSVVPAAPPAVYDAQHSSSLKRDRPAETHTTDGRSISPSIENAAEWLKRQRTTEDATATAAAVVANAAPPVHQHPEYAVNGGYHHPHATHVPYTEHHHPPPPPGYEAHAMAAVAAAADFLVTTPPPHPMASTVTLTSSNETTTTIATHAGTPTNDVDAAIAAAAHYQGQHPDAAADASIEYQGDDAGGIAGALEHITRY